VRNFLKSSLPEIYSVDSSRMAAFKAVGNAGKVADGVKAKLAAAGRPMGRPKKGWCVCCIYIIAYGAQHLCRGAKEHTIGISPVVAGAMVYSKVRMRASSLATWSPAPVRATVATIIGQYVLDTDATVAHKCARLVFTGVAGSKRRGQPIVAKECSTRKKVFQL
jgi:hypothetical protein